MVTDSLTGTTVPVNKVCKAEAAVLVNCSAEAAFIYISGNNELPHWLKKAGPVSGAKNVEVLTGSYAAVGDKRKVVFEDGDTIQEELISYHPFDNYAYRVTAFSDFFRHLTNAAYGQWWFQNKQEKIKISWVYSYTYKNILGGLFIRFFNFFFFRRFMQNGLNNAKAQIENKNA